MKGILFKPSMFKATIDGTKTETRRTISKTDLSENINEKWARDFMAQAHARYKVDDIVYLKEPYVMIRKYPLAIEEPNKSMMEPEYKYDKQPLVQKIIPWENKLFMPAKYARYFIKITEVKVERLQEITEEGAIAEGIEYDGNGHSYMCYSGKTCCFETAIESYADLWDFINVKCAKKNKAVPWESNPWVWVYKYRLLDPEETQNTLRLI